MSLFRRRQLRRLQALNTSPSTITTGGWAWASSSPGVWTSKQSWPGGREALVRIDFMDMNGSALFDVSYKLLDTLNDYYICTYNTWEDAVSGAQAFMNRENP